MPRFNRGSGSTRACPATSDPEALRLYGAMIDKYAVVPDTALRRVGARRLVAEVRVDSVGIVDSTRLRPMMVGGNSNIHREYARLPGSNVDPRIGRWVYPWLESIAAQHFIEGKFLEWNAVASGARSARGTILRFCSRRATPEHYIQGELVLGTGGNLLQADFRFVAPAGPENAGGSVFFLPISPGRVTRLRPVAGFFWRQQGDRYYTEWLEYQEWR